MPTWTDTCQKSGKYVRLESEIGKKKSFAKKLMVSKETPDVLGIWEPK